MTPFRERNPVIIGLVSMSVLAVLLVAAFRAQDLPVIGGGDTYYAEFAEAGGLQSDDEVRIAGVRVGQVKSIELADGVVRVAFQVKTDSGFGPDSRADIKVKTLLGSMYISLDPAGSGQLEEGATIPVERTSSPFDVVEAFEGLADTAGDIDTDQLARSLTTLADLTRNTPEEFRAALDGVSRLSTNIADKNEEIGSLLQNLERVSSVLDDRDEDLVDLMSDADVLFQALVARRDQIHRLLVSTQELSRELTRLVRDTRGDLEPALQELEDVLAVLNKNEDNIDDSIRLMAPFYRVFTNTLGSGPWFDTYIQNLPPVPEVLNGGGIS
ncbi:MCE family protein [Nocardioides cremeus]|jgi:phospholipid/cholesterol/gamma-HCH transport system substrate-binding protein|uniref:MCE family protein n=1 Tax=Nocardioides cremeus TaxID=3058044 RepID=A0ABT8TKT4_9ACTN|nr:MCE family protein [Nocardioides cremeus]MDO3394568.1 MCE family protein [Nocardioides cremeus]